LYSTQDLKYDHITLRRLKNIIERCSDKLYANENVPIEDIEIISVIIEEFVDTFHHGKEEQAYFPEATDKKDEFAEDIRKFLIEHELGRRIAIMLRRELNIWKEHKGKKKRTTEEGQGEEGIEVAKRVRKLAVDNVDAKIKEPTARFLKSYAVFIADHTQKEDKFFDLVQKTNIISEKEDQKLLQHYEVCKNEIGGRARIEQILRLIEYLESSQWMRDK
jgi:hemerythrin-like domain-containing protein